MEPRDEPRDRRPPMRTTSLRPIAALISFVWTPYNYAAQDIPNKLKGMSAAHWFGTMTRPIEAFI